MIPLTHTNYGQWIASDLANELELTKKQTFVKVAATTADILVVLMTLWTRANDIPCDRETRVAFHARILLASMGGFRRGTLDKLKYSQIKMHLSRPGKKTVENMSVFGDLTLYYNKQQTDKICTSQDDVYVTVPNPLLPLSSLEVSDN